MLSSKLLPTIAEAARALNVPPSMLAALIEIESGGTVETIVAGRAEPLIRFEGHYFDRRLSGKDRRIAREAGLADPNAGRIRNPRRQSERWAMLRRAEAIDRSAGRESVSWGCGQVMGSHWQALGYESVDDLVAAARTGFDGQLELVTRYLSMANLTTAMRGADFVAVARGYNGPNYRANRYDEKLRAANARYRSAFGHEVQSSESASAGLVLRLGHSGPAVSELQRLLNTTGSALAVDGRFGARTKRAVEAFQHKHGLAVDGVVGPATRAALDDVRSTGHLRTLAVALGSLLAELMTRLRLGWRH